MAGMVFKQGGMGGSAVRAFCYTHTPTAETADGGGLTRFHGRFEAKGA